MILTADKHEMLLEIFAGRACQCALKPWPALPAIDRVNSPARMRKLRRLSAVELVIRETPDQRRRAVVRGTIVRAHVLSAANASAMETPREHDPDLWACYRAVWMARQEIRTLMQTRRRA